MKNILIIGPFLDKGGREQESGFIANVLSKKFKVDIISTADMTMASEIYNSYNKGKVTSLKEMLFKKNMLFRFFSLIAYVKNNKRNEKFNYVNNAINKRLGYSKQIVLLLKNVLLKYDLVFINAQLTSSLMNEIVSFSFLNKKPIVFRTSGEIYNFQLKLNYINKVSLFIHHSNFNASKIKNLIKSQAIIDQCSFIEEKLLTIPVRNKIEKFIIIGRLAKDKGIDNLISFFIKYPNKSLSLEIYGEGEMGITLIKKYESYKNIKFKGYFTPTKLYEVFENNEVLIIPSFNEAGPLVGIEAMAAGRLILSTKVGAMQERLINTNNDFWFDISNYDTFKHGMDKLLNTSEEERTTIANNLRNRYLSKYSAKNISNKYITTVEEFIGLENT
ncbi:glycosyltransferase [Algibacter pectinivorans]|uniref:Glycosyltransferase involved in cell wall bisynthesis n=1 Tax=Algibacter pectinivorans TaxID=870482 RepID=A0A1I1NZ57_9FLAO|nr:glycosyltransferase [Algibacter pectinivorans]SFD02612.1 Glycosyltransferase involved in cell wall bisynthesis [Algibacter pectinivorans]